jgi:sensor histidine kinase YesM
VFSFTLPLAGPDARAEEAAPLPAAIAGYNEAAAALSGPDVPAAGREPAPPAAAVRGRILAVDDDPINLNVLADVLAAERYEVTTAGSGEEALAMLDGKEWDLLVADVMMPHMSGYELARTVRERYSPSELPILLLTARSRPEDIEAGFQSGANDYVSKPTDAAELRARVRALTGLTKSVRERLRMEAAWLQAQIKPHFLYNTLNSVAALSEIDTERMRMLLNEFGHYLRASFDTRNSQQLVPLEHELGLVRSYLFIEQERFGDKLSVSWELDEGLDVLVPPLSIQPLVENAVRHGLMKRTCGGQIRIRVADGGDRAEIAIADNGVGMDDDQLRQLLDSGTERRTGIGLLNTNRRLKRLYGKGLQVESAEGKGTTVSFAVSK